MNSVVFAGIGLTCCERFSGNLAYPYSFSRAISHLYVLGQNNFLPCALNIVTLIMHHYIMLKCFHNISALVDHRIAV